MALFTSGGAAETSGVSPSVISRAVDEGSLQGLRIPGSNVRRVDSGHLRTWLTKHGLSTERLERTLPGLLVVSRNAELKAKLGQLLPQNECTVIPAASLFDAGLHVAGRNLGLIAVDVAAVSAADAPSLRALKQWAEKRGIPVVGVTRTPGESCAERTGAFMDDRLPLTELIERAKEILNEARAFTGPRVQQILAEPETQRNHGAPRAHRE